MLEIVEMIEEYAEIISFWTYPEPYDIYNMKADEEEIEQLMNGLHVAVMDGDELVGFVAFGWSAQVICAGSKKMYEDESYTDVAFGLRPDLCGKGLGLSLVKCAIDFVKELFPEDGVRLTVRSDNERAIKVYERAGFTPLQSFRCKGSKFVAMIL